MALDPYSERARALGDKSPFSPEGKAFDANHEIRGPHPVFQAHGWSTDHPCALSGCPRHNEDYVNRLDDAQMAKVHETRTLSPDQFSQLHPLESVVDHDHVQSSGNTRPPVVAELPGYPGLHVLDGHHRLLRAQQAGRAIDVHVKSG